MKSHLLVGLVILCIVGSLAGPGDAFADDKKELADKIFEKYKHRGRSDGSRKLRDEDQRGEENRSRGISLDQAVNLVRRSMKGKVIRSETRYEDGKPVHVVKLLSDDGRVRTVRVDGISGRIR